MTEQLVSLNSTTDTDHSKLYINQTSFARLGDLIRDNQQAASVMLTLVSSIGVNGAVQTTQAVLAHQCGMKPKDLVQAIAYLSSTGLISSVNVSNELGGHFACVVNPDLARAGSPDKTCPVTLAEGA
ncbi:hypothetical protein [Pseudomonas putida]|uniref:hypothetical protein n=1 Tax=Pseudomonas putida TaxID=303 RepID=UPI004046DFF6